MGNLKVPDTKESKEGWLNLLYIKETSRKLKIYSIYFKDEELVVLDKVSSDYLGIGKIIDCHWYDTLNKLLRITGYISRFKTNICQWWIRWNQIRQSNSSEYQRK